MDRIKANIDIASIIIDKIERAGRSPFLFIGSGFSRRYAKSENWEDLLRYVCSLYSDSPLKYEEYKLDVDRDSPFGEKPSIASMIENDFAREVLQSQKLEEFKDDHIEDIKQGRSLVKIAISDHLHNLRVEVNQKEFELFCKLTNKISGIITTNYDTLLDQTFEDFTSYNSQDDLLFSNSFNVAEIYHIHGSINDPDTLVLTSDDYEIFSQKRDYLAAKLLTIFLEYPIIFIGYSIEDQNVIEILKSIANCLGASKLTSLKDRLIFIGRGVDSVSTHSIAFDGIGSIEMTKLTTNDFSLIYDAISQINISFIPSVLRELRKQIFEISDELDPTSKVSVTGFSGLEKIPDDQKIVIGLGKTSSKVPGAVVTAEMVYRDIVIDDQYLTPSLMVEEHLEHLLGTNPGGLPVHKYVSGYSSPERINTPRLLRCITEHTTIESFRNAQLNKSSENYRNKYTPLSVESVVAREGENEAYKRLVYLSEDEIDINALGEYLARLIRDNPSIIIGNSELKRLIRIYDLLKYKQNALDKSLNSE